MILFVSRGHIIKFRSSRLPMFALTKVLVRVQAAAIRKIGSNRKIRKNKA